MIFHDQGISDGRIAELIESGGLAMVGSQQTGTYGRPWCRGPRSAPRHCRVYFVTETEALEAGYQPCPLCCPEQYEAWRAQRVPPKSDDDARLPDWK